MQFFESIDYTSVENFKTAGGLARSHGTGIVSLIIDDKSSSKTFILNLTNVAYMPSAPMNLVSIGKLQHQQGFYLNNRKQVLENGKQSIHVVELGELYYIEGRVKLGQINLQVRSELRPSGQSVRKAVSIVDKTVDRTDWQLLRPKFDRLNSKYGPFQLELFKNKTNNLLPANGVTDSFDLSWYGKIIYGNPVFLNKFIYRTLEKAVTDFKQDPENTVFVLVVPKWETANWYVDFVKYFDIVKEWPKDTELFSIPYRSHFDPLVTKMTPDGRVIVDGVPWPVVVLYKDSNTTTRIDSKLLAHMRFGHYGPQKLADLHKTGASLGLTYDTTRHFLDCAACRLAKATRPSHPPSNRGGSTLPGQLIFTDILVLNIESKEGYQYIVQFTDDFSRYTKVYFLRTRDGVYSAMEKFIKWFPTQVNHTSPMLMYKVQHMCIRTIQSDNAGEYTKSEVFKDILARNNIGLRSSAPYVHENAAIAERLWRTLEDIVRAMMVTGQIPKRLWPVVFRHSVYIYNKIPHPHHKNDKSPEEVLTGKKPDLSKVRVLWSRAYAYLDPGEPIRKKAGHKLDNRAVPYRYAGHDEDSTTYLLYDEENETIVRKGMVKIVEEVDLYGKLISKKPSQRITLRLPDKIPEPFENNYESTNSTVEIKGIQTYYDKDDQEIYGIVFIQTDSRKVWVKALDLIKENPANFIKLKEYIEGNRKNNTFYPVFALVKAKQGQERHEAIIVSNDRVRAECYGIVHYDGYFEDVRHTKIEFGHNPIALSMFGSDIPNQGGSEEISLDERIQENVFYILYTESSEPLQNGRISSEYLGYIEPTTYKQVLNDKYKPHWVKALQKEIDQLKELKTFRVIKSLPSGKKAVQTKVVYKLKLLEDGTLDKFKARLVAKGFTQIYGIDFIESFSPTPSLTTTRFILIIGLHFGMRPYAADVRGAFLNAEIKEEIIIKFPDGITVDNCEYAVLLKSLYGLHQAGRDWNEMSDRIIKSFDSNIQQSLTEPCLYFIWTKELKFLMSVHVDDYTIMCDSTEYYNNLMTHFKKYVEIEEKGTPKIILQMGLTWSPNLDVVSFSQKRQIIRLYHEYSSEIRRLGVKRHDTPMESELKLYAGEKDNLPDVPYRSAIGAMLFIARMSRPDILYAINVLSRLNTCYTIQHWKYVLRVIVYLFHTADLQLTYRKNPESARTLVQYCDSSHGDDKQDGTSTCGNITYMYGNAASWNIEKQPDVSLSTSEAEYKTLTYAFRDGMYFYNIFHSELKLTHWFPILTYIDNKGAGYMAETAQNNKRTKHIHIQYHFVREKVQQRVHELEYVESANNISDIFTKPLPKGSFEKFRKLMLNY